MFVRISENNTKQCFPCSKLSVTFSANTKKLITNMAGTNLKTFRICMNFVTWGFWGHFVRIRRIVFYVLKLIQL